MLADKPWLSEGSNSAVARGQRSRNPHPWINQEILVACRHRLRKIWGLIRTEARRTELQPRRSSTTGFDDHW